LADADFGGEMDDAVDILECLGDGVAIADIGANQLDIGIEIVGSFAVAVDLLDEAVEDSNLMASVLKLPGNRAADEPGPAGNENAFRQFDPR
jgi:hypothetical protein